jgi:hypothetical protein
LRSVDLRENADSEAAEFPFKGANVHINVRPPTIERPAWRNVSFGSAEETSAP